MSDEMTTTSTAVTTEPTIAELAARVATLERSVGWLQKLSVTLAAVLAAVGMSGAADALKDASFGTVKARDIQIVDDGGNTTVRITSDKAAGRGNCGAVVIASAERNTKDAPKYMTVIEAGQPYYHFSPDSP